jgi:hypothetical protein
VFAEDANQAMQSPRDTVREKEQQAKSGAFVRDVASRS